MNVDIRDEIAQNRRHGNRKFTADIEDGLLDSIEIALIQEPDISTSFIRNFIAKVTNTEVSYVYAKSMRKRCLDRMNNG